MSDVIRRRLKFQLQAALFRTVLFAVSTWSLGAFAEPQQLDCVLTDTEAHTGLERRPLVIIFDQDAKTLSVTDGDHNYNFSEVSMSSVTISGLADDISVGVDRSSLGIVWQQYRTDKVLTEYGHCRFHS